MSPSAILFAPHRRELHKTIDGMTEFKLPLIAFLRFFLHMTGATSRASFRGARPGTTSGGRRTDGGTRDGTPCLRKTPPHRQTRGRHADDRPGSRVRRTRAIDQRAPLVRPRRWRRRRPCLQARDLIGVDLGAPRRTTRKMAAGSARARVARTGCDQWRRCHALALGVYTLLVHAGPPLDACGHRARLCMARGASGDHLSSS